MHALPVNLPCVKQLPVITNEAGASLHAGSTCAIGVVTVRPFNRQPAQLYFKLTPNPNNTFFFIFTCTTQYPWVLANPDLSQAMASSKQKRTHTVFRASSTHRSASTSKPRFVGEKVKLGELLLNTFSGEWGTEEGELLTPVLRTSNFNEDGSLNYSTPAMRCIPEGKVAKKRMVRGDIILEKSGGTPKRPVGIMAFYDSDALALCSNFNQVLRFDESRILPRFAFHQLRWLKDRNAFDRYTRKTTGLQNLQMKKLIELKLRVPQIEAQTSIATTLDEIVCDQRTLQQEIACLDSLVKSRFVEMFGSSSADSRYEVCRIGDIADVFVGVVVKPKQYYTDDHANGIKAFRSLNVGEMQVRDDDWVYFSKEGNKKAKKTQLHAGDVLVVRSGYPGTSCVVPLLYEGCNAVDLIIARSNSNNVLPEYIAAFNNGSHMKSLINQMSVGSAQKHFNIGFYRNVEIPLPPLSAQKEYVSFLRQVNKSRFVRDHEINFR